MKIIADLEIHSHYSRAVSKKNTPEEIEFTAWKKGINIIGTGDCSHPGWVSELKEKLEEIRPGLYKIKKKYSHINWQSNRGPYFLIGGEIATVYKHSHRTRKVHTLVYVPNFKIVDKILKQLTKRGNINYDGRPIIGITTQELGKIFWDTDPNCEIIPAHVWTPWFGLFGSKSGYDSVQDCFGEDSNKIHALETGLSSDPKMNWQLSQNDRFTLISSSDAHSLPNIGREATVFELDIKNISYDNIMNAIRFAPPAGGQRTKSGFVGTIEFFPEEGMYHNDGHRACGMNLTPFESKKLKNICPNCGKSLTLGVLHRINDLSDRVTNKYINKNHQVWYSIPLLELIAEIRGVKSKLSTKVVLQYEYYLEKMTEFDILLFAPLDDLKKILSPELVHSIEAMREGKIYKVAGFDGVYGKISVNPPQKKDQTNLFNKNE